MSDLEKRTHDSAGNEYGVHIWTTTDPMYHKGLLQGRTDTLKAVREAIEAAHKPDNEGDELTRCYNLGIDRALQALTKMEKTA